MLRPRRGLQIPFPVKYRKKINPLDGMWSFAPGQEIPPGASPDMLNVCIRQNRLEKRPGYAQHTAGNSAIGTRVMGIFSADDESGNTHLYAVHPTGLAKYNTGTKVWDACTGSALTGGNERRFTFAVSQNSVVFCQGVDQVNRIPFNTTYAILNANCPPARFLERFADRLYIAYTVEGGNPKPFRVKRPVASDHTDWTGVGSGFNELTETPYFIKNILKLGQELAIYTEKSIWMAFRLGQAATPAGFRLAVADIGLYSPYCVSGYVDHHFFKGNDNFYRFDGSKTEEIGTPIRDIVFGDLSLNYLHMNFSVAHVGDQEWINFICTGTSQVPDTAWVYNWKRNVWYPWSVSGPLSGCIHKLSTSLTIDELIGTIDQQNYEIDSLPLQSSLPSLLTGHSDGKIYIWSSFYSSDDGTAISCRWTSKDFISEDLDESQTGKEITLRTIHVDYVPQAMAATLSFAYSVDGGVNWVTAGNVTLAAGTSAGLSTASLHRQVTGNRIRFRFTHSSASETFKIAAFRLEAEIRGADLTA